MLVPKFYLPTREPHQMSTPERDQKLNPRLTLRLHTDTRQRLKQVLSSFRLKFPYVCDLIVANLPTDPAEFIELMERHPDLLRRKKGDPSMPVTCVFGGASLAKLKDLLMIERVVENKALNEAIKAKQKETKTQNVTDYKFHTSTRYQLSAILRVALAVFLKDPLKEFPSAKRQKQASCFYNDHLPVRKLCDSYYPLETANYDRSLKALIETEIPVLVDDSILILSCMKLLKEGQSSSQFDMFQDGAVSAAASKLLKSATRRRILLFQGHSTLFAERLWALLEAGGGEPDDKSAQALFEGFVKKIKHVSALSLDVVPLDIVPEQLSQMPQPAEGVDFTTRLAISATKAHLDGAPFVFASAVVNLPSVADIEVYRPMDLPRRPSEVAEQEK